TPRPEDPGPDSPGRSEVPRVLDPATPVAARRRHRRTAADAAGRRHGGTGPRDRRTGAARIRDSARGKCPAIPGRSCRSSRPPGDVPSICLSVQANRLALSVKTPAHSGPAVPQFPPLSLGIREAQMEDVLLFIARIVFCVIFAMSAVGHL